MKISLNKIFLLALIVLILFFIVPNSFALDNCTCDEISLSGTNDYYFDSTVANDSGDGSSASPYKYLRDGRILDDSVIHLAEGEYAYSQSNSHSNISFYGSDASRTVINGQGSTLTVDDKLTLKDVTIFNLTIISNGNLYASNTIFSNSIAQPSSYDYSYGGAVNCLDDIVLNNCTFISNYAKYGGALYLANVNADITDCSFINNTAYSYGGAIACDGVSSNKSSVNIKNTVFINSKSLTDAGGAIYLKKTLFKGENLNISSGQATFGGGICLLDSYSKLNNIYASNNTAFYNGGFIYQIYGNITLTQSQFFNNRAENGGVLYIDGAYFGWVVNNTFKYNSANLTAGAFYSLLNDYFKIDKNIYSNNHAGQYDDLYEQLNLTLTIVDSGYTTYLCNISNENLPSYYNSVDEGYVTSVKNQEDSGNCWAFSSLSCLESCILKAGGDEIDLSEENMKNIASFYSQYGWSMDTNDGGYDDMAVGYLVSWLGPVLESEDEFEASSTLSKLFSSLIHVQNINYYKRNSYTNITSIKKAIMDYGAVCTSIYMIPEYDSGISAYAQCYLGNHSCDHSIVLVGWDDSIAISDAPAKGAWIAKNSWGSSWGNDGYFYVSYYDTSCPKLNDYEGVFTFILNDTVKYDKNYQYDVAKTDWFFNKSSTVWYKNIFTSTDSEYLAAVSTYFEKDSSWTLSIYVNGKVKLTKSGTSAPGYHTIDLGEYISLNAGDVFEVVFKIKTSGNAGFPISEVVSLNKYFYTENISFVSYDGKNWQDLYKLEWEYPDHSYSSQVACIKAFTILNPINASISVSIENRTYDGADILVSVSSQYNNVVNVGNVIFNLSGTSYTVPVKNGIAVLSVNLKSTNLICQFIATGYSSPSKTVEIANPLVNTNINLSVSGTHNPLNITAEVNDENGNPVRYGAVNFSINAFTYTVNVSDGTACLENLYVTPGKINVTVTFSDLFYYNSSSAKATFEISKIKTNLTLNIDTNEFSNPVNITAVVKDSDNAAVNRGAVYFNISGNVYNASVSGGKAGLYYVFSDIGQNTISAYFFDEYVYDSSSSAVSVDVSKIRVNMTLTESIYDNNAVFKISIKDADKDYGVIIFLNNKTSYKLSENGSVVCEFSSLDDGNYNYTVKLISSVYESDNLYGSFNITMIKTQLSYLNSTVYNKGNYSVVLKDSHGNLLQDQDVYLTINQKTLKSRTDSYGIAQFAIDLDEGEYSAGIAFIGTDDYAESDLSTSVNVKSTIQSSSSKFAYNSKYYVVFKDSNGNLLSNRGVSIAVNNAVYKLTTDSNGIAYVTLMLDAGSYEVKITNTPTGEVKTESIKVVKRITGNSALKMYYGAGKYYKVRVCDDNGNYKAGLKVTFKINGKTYKRYTDEDGYASLKINLKPKTYKITAKYKGYKVSNKIKVKSTIVTKNYSIKKGKTLKFKVKLLNSKGKILKKKKIKIKFKGKTYKVKTNKKGIATLKIKMNYKAGKYKIVTSYGKLKITNKIKIKK